MYKWLSQKSHEAVEKGDGLSISEFDLGSIRIFEVTTDYKTGNKEKKEVIQYSHTVYN